MSRKKTRGMTLVELILAMAILVIVSLAVGSAMVAASESYALTARMQDDEYNARLALLSITREIHRGVKDANFHSDDELSYLELIMADENGDAGEIVTFTFENSELTRTGTSPVGFVPVELKSFTANTTFDPNRIEIEIVCTNDMVLRTKVAKLRIPA